MAWKYPDVERVEQATAAPGEKRDLAGWRFLGPRSAGPCPNCGSLNTYTEMIDATVAMQIPGMKVCRDCSGPSGE